MVEKILIFGGSGFLGSRLINNLINDYEITVASRNPDNISRKIINVNYSKYKNDVNSFLNLIDGKNIIINFSGASIADKRWDDKYKKVLYDSRVKTTSLISQAIALCKDKPHTFVSTSATGIYGNRGDEILDESSSNGNDFLSNMCIDWENEAFKSQHCGVRTVCIRVGVVLDKNEGGFNRMIQPFKFFVGGKLGDGKQYLPWVHVEDIVRIFVESLKNVNLSGAVNGTAPNPVTNSEFSKAVAKSFHRPNLFKVPKLALRIILGEFAEFLTGSQRVIPKKLSDEGFVFRYNDIYSALNNLIEP